MQKPENNEFRQVLAANRATKIGCHYCAGAGLIEIQGTMSGHPLTHWRSILDTHMPCLHCGLGREMAANFDAERETESRS